MVAAKTRELGRAVYGTERSGFQGYSPGARIGQWGTRFSRGKAVHWRQVGNDGDSAQHQQMSATKALPALEQGDSRYVKYNYIK